MPTDDTRGGEPGAPDAGEETFRRLGQRLDQASEAAERLFAQAAGEAAARIGGAAKAPPRGWQIRPDEPEPESPGELALLLQAVQSLRDLMPPDLQRRLVEAIREVLLAVRALIDWYLERIELRHAEPVQVQDIPVL